MKKVIINKVLSKNMKEPAYPPRIRRKWYFLVDSLGFKVTDVCKRYMIPRKTYYKWRKIDLGSRIYKEKRRHPNLKLTDEIKLFVEKTKRKTNYGPLKMRYLIKKRFGIDVSTTVIYRFYKKRGLIKKPQKRLRWYAPLKERIKAKNRGEMVQMDVKYVYKQGLRMYQFSVPDPTTQMYFLSIFKTKESKNAITAFKKTENYFGFKILSVQTDNGSEFRGEFHDFCQKNNVSHYFIPKRSPWWNGYVERVHKTINDEFYFNPERAWNSVWEWLEFYNKERIHLTLNGLTPYEKSLESVTLEC